MRLVPQLPALLALGLALATRTSCVKSAEGMAFCPCFWHFKMNMPADYCAFAASSQVRFRDYMVMGINFTWATRVFAQTLIVVKSGCDSLI